VTDEEEEKEEEEEDDDDDDEYSEAHQPPIQRVPVTLSTGYCILLTNDNQIHSEIKRGDQ
jgi:hypothetical protein